LATKQRHIADEVFRDLLKKILDGVYPSGTRLPPERELASNYGTNRNTLREALRRLEQANLLKVRQGQGITVVDYKRHGTIDLLGYFLLDSSETQEKFNVLEDLLLLRRQVLENAVSLAAERAEPTDITRIRTIAETLKKTYVAKDHQGLVRGDIDFVDAIVDASHSLAVRWVANTLMTVYERFAESSNVMWIMEETYPAYLSAVCDHIESGHAEQATVSVRTYFNRVDARLVEIIDKLSKLSPHGGK
jgi:GntR family transcriptional repressor for pyruvate dehydrogenase complex